jgi:hypothetical protein
MPLTPFHFGPGFLIKSVLAKRFSFRIFVLANIITDMEPLYFLVTNQWPVHRVFHTYLGATVIALGCVAVGRPVCYRLTNIWNTTFKNLKVDSGKIAAPALLTAAFTGTYSHVFLDSIMHGDLRPFYPWTRSNGLLDIISYGQLHLFCVLAGAIGIVIFGITKHKHRSLFQ